MPPKTVVFQPRTKYCCPPHAPLRSSLLLDRSTSYFSVSAFSVSVFCPVHPVACSVYPPWWANPPARERFRSLRDQFSAFQFFALFIQSRAREPFRSLRDQRFSVSVFKMPFRNRVYPSWSKPARRGGWRPWREFRIGVTSDI